MLVLILNLWRVLICPLWTHHYSTRKCDVSAYEFVCYVDVLAVVGRESEENACTGYIGCAEWPLFRGFSESVSMLCLCMWDAPCPMLLNCIVNYPCACLRDTVYTCYLLSLPATCTAPAMSALHIRYDL